MSDHYTVDAEMRFLSEVDSKDATAIRYVLGLTDQEPDPLPTHECYGGEIGLADRRLNAQFLAPGGVVTLFDRSVSQTTEIAGSVLHVRVPGSKLEGVYEDNLPLIDWLAQFCSDGFVGHVRGEDTDELLMLLYILDRQLFIVPDIGEPAGSLRTGERRDVGRGKENARMQES